MYFSFFDFFWAVLFTFPGVFLPQSRPTFPTPFKEQSQTWKTKKMKKGTKNWRKKQPKFQKKKKRRVNQNNTWKTQKTDLNDFLKYTKFWMLSKIKSRPDFPEPQSGRKSKRKSGVAQKIKWPPRGTVTIVLTCSGSAPRKQARWVERSNFSWIGRQLTLDKTSAPGCGDTLKALAATSVRSRDRIVFEDGFGVAKGWVTGWSYSLHTETAQCAVRPT